MSNAVNDNSVLLFEEMRPTLIGLAYRILSSISDAEDMVQDTFIKWKQAHQSTIDNPQAWLKTVCTRCCLDLLGSANNKRVNYIGGWLPEPIVTERALDGAELLELDQSLTTAFLLMLERLTAKERAAYLLYEIFDCSYTQVAETLATNETACRQLVSRAKGHITRHRVRNVVSQEQQNRFLDAFQVAIVEGNSSLLEELLSNDITLNADGGGKASAIREPVIGLTAVIKFLIQRLNKYWEQCQWQQINLNYTMGFCLRKAGNIIAVASFSYDDDGHVDGIYIMRNPDKINIDKSVVMY